MAAQRSEQLLDAARRKGIKRGGGFVAEQDFGADGKRARQAQALLLPTREPGRRRFETILDLLPQSNRA